MLSNGDDAAHPGIAILKKKNLELIPPHSELLVLEPDFKIFLIRLVKVANGRG